MFHEVYLDRQELEGESGPKHCANSNKDQDNRQHVNYAFAVVEIFGYSRQMRPSGNKFHHSNRFKVVFLKYGLDVTQSRKYGALSED